MAFAVVVATQFFIAPASQAATVSAPLPAGYHLAAKPIDTTAVTRAMSAHGGYLTKAQLAALGVTPGTIYTDTPQARALATGLHEKASTGKVARPASGSGCNFDVCIEVTGTGLEVTKWYTAAYAPGTSSICASPVFWIDGGIDIVGDEICGTLLEAWDDQTEYFDDQTQLCNTWTGVAGKPCLVVHT
jgi:hypothetical protein